MIDFNLEYDYGGGAWRSDKDLTEARGPLLLCDDGVRELMRGIQPFGLWAKTKLSVICSGVMIPESFQVVLDREGTQTVNVYGVKGGTRRFGLTTPAWGAVLRIMQQVNRDDEGVRSTPLQMFCRIRKLKQ